MAARYDLIKCINASPVHKVWKLKVRVIRLWTVFQFAKSGMKAPIEMVVLDEEGDTIQCTVKDIFVPMFEGLLAEGNVGGQKLRVTFWQSFASDLLKYLEEHPCLTYVVILQMGKIKFYSGVMGVSNTNYNSKLFINVEFPAARDFFARVNKLDPVDGQGIMPLVCDQPVSVEKDFLRLSVDKTIAEIKEHNQDAVFVTAGTIKEVETEFGWWYKGYKKCRRGLRELEKRYFCPNCIRDYGFYESRYNIHIRVIDHTDAASFVLFDGEALNLKGVEKNSCPEEINKLRNIKFIFKVQLKMRNLNSYEPYVMV
ncbi:uncharacterized protein LOC130933863 [Arachis stenosperma]|uniref:uncharacterized protein LOC130933863 n=1 Tax=Arachis stenosperma TaxID=217475 RepID=UPI0025AD8FE8|nr:uncharacterized protein LOC130933863 [Arachis stenosperma]